MIRTTQQLENITPELIKGCIQQHREEVTRLEKLYKYYKGETEITKRSRGRAGTPNNKIACPHPYYITTIVTGYCFGNPLTYKPVDDESKIDTLLEANKRAKVESHDAELGEDLSIFGSGYELVHMSADKQPFVKLNNLSPLNTFVVYSNAVGPEPGFACYYFPIYGTSGSVDSYEINIYDNKEQTVYTATGLDALPVLKIEPKPHFAGQVPIVEYDNNTEKLGDYERVISLIDAYDRLQSDRLNDKDQFIDSILALYGANLAGDDSETTKAISQLALDKLLELPVDAKAEYLSRTLDETGVEVLRLALARDIAKFSLVPELTDENFASNASGVAMSYKTLGLQWLCNIKKRMFTKGLQRRLAIIATYLQAQGKHFDPQAVEVVFNASLPANAPEIIQAAATASTVVSERSAINYIAPVMGITDVDEELQQKEKEQQESSKRQADAFNAGNQYGASGGEE